MLRSLMPSCPGIRSYSTKDRSALNLRRLRYAAAVLLVTVCPPTFSEKMLLAIVVVSDRSSEIGSGGKGTRLVAHHDPDCPQRCTDTSDTEVS